MKNKNDLLDESLKKFYFTGEEKAQKDGWSQADSGNEAGSRNWQVW